MPSDLLTIGRLARLTGMPVKTIRFYSDAGLLPPRQVSAARYRLYATEDQARLELIRTLRSVDVDLPSIRRLLDGQRGLRDLLRVQLEAVEATLRLLARRRAVLRAALQKRPAPSARRRPKASSVTSSASSTNAAQPASSRSAGRSLNAVS